MKRLETELLGSGMLLGSLNQLSQEHKILQWTELTLEKEDVREGKGELYSAHLSLKS